MPKLTDKNKLAIIEGLKKQVEKANEDRRNDPNWKMPTKRTKLQFRRNQFDEIDRAWLTDILDHLGVDSVFV